MPFRRGEIHIFDSAGHKVLNNKIQLELRPQYIILGKTCFKSDSIVPFNMP